MSLDDLDLQLRSQLSLKTQKRQCPFLVRNFAVDLDEIQYVVTTFWFVEAHAKLVLYK